MEFMRSVMIDDFDVITFSVKRRLITPIEDRFMNEQRH
jgi:hypothetical protein